MLFKKKKKVRRKGEGRESRREGEREEGRKKNLVILEISLA